MENYIGFPGLNISLNISNVAFKIGDKEIYWYGIIIAAALAVCYISGYIRAKKKNINPEIVTDIVLYSTPVAIIFARLYYVIFSLDYYIKYPQKIFAINEGGIAIYGAVLGAVLTAFIYCKVKKLDTLQIFDLCIPFVALGQAIGRWGNFFNKEAFGTVTDSFFRMAIYQNNKLIEVHPTFLYESVCNLIIFSFLIYIDNRKKRNGETFFSYFIFYGFIRFFIEGLRTDSLYLYNIRISQLVAVITLIIGVVAIIFLKKSIKTEVKND